MCLSHAVLYSFSLGQTVRERDKTYTQSWDVYVYPSMDFAGKKEEEKKL